MKRRKFIISSGATILSSTAIATTQKPAVGLGFEISTPDANPSNVDALHIDFTSLEITPQYLDDGIQAKISAKVTVEDKFDEEEVQTKIENGATEQLSDNIGSMKINDLTKSNPISGEVTVEFNHPDINQSYTQNFLVSDSPIPDLQMFSDPVYQFWAGASTSSDGDKTSFPE